MAVEASRSGSSVDTYIGSLISLTSKSEIRYEGILYNINTEESSIGLRNVRSFGTEGRKKDGPQIPASDKIYEYILFRGSDIKDLQVKSSLPPAQSTPIQNDPAIIQTHYVRPASTSSSLPSVVSGNVGDVTSNTAQSGLPRPTFQGSLPLYQPGAGLGSWGSSPTPPTANGSGLAMAPMYWQGYFSPSSGLPHLQQQTLLQPPPGMPIPHPMQQQLQYPGMNALLLSGSQNLSELPPPLFPPVSSTSGLTSSSLPPLPSVSSPSTLAHETSTLLPSKTSITNVPPSTLGVSLPSVSTMTSNIEPIATVLQNMPVLSGKVNTVTVPTVAYQTVSQSGHSIVGSSTSKVETSVQLVTPGQLLQTSSPTHPSSQPLQTGKKDADIKAVQAKTKPLLADPSVRLAAEAKEPILPLPKPAMQKPNGASSHTQYYNRNRGRGRGNAFSRPVSEFTEDFDFMAMNEKFNKDEVWGHLGKKKAVKDKDGELEEDEADYTVEQDEEKAVNSEIKPVYVKDDFFDSLSCTALDQRNRYGRTKFSEQLKIDAETFGDFNRHRPYRGGGRGFRGGSRGRGSYYGRGYGYAARGRGHSFSNRAP